jgi:hypothetical protein
VLIPTKIEEVISAQDYDVREHLAKVGKRRIEDE